MTHFRHNMTRSEFLDWLRYSAIAGGMPQQFIDRIDDLHGAPDLQAELVELGDELTQAENDRDDLHEELAALVKAIADDDGAWTSKSVKTALKCAKAALGRHGGTCHSAAC